MTANNTLFVTSNRKKLLRNLLHNLSTIKLDGKEQRIVATLTGLIESAGRSYEQACLDLRDNAKCSYRGAAAELRETLREVLDHLAPDKEVISQNKYYAAKIN